MIKVWITGARGFIGRHLAQHLAETGFRVSGIGHGHWPEQQADAWGVSSWLNGDLCISNLETFRHAVGLPEIIYNLTGGASVGASIENPRSDFCKTVDSSSELLEWIRLTCPQTRLVAVSSAAVYGASHLGKIKESDDVFPYSPYGYHKFMMEEMCRYYARHYGINISIARLFSVYGKYLRKQLLWDLCNKFNKATGRVGLGGSGQERRDWTDVGDVVIGLALVANQADENVPVFNLGTGIDTTVMKIAETVRECWSQGESNSVEIEFNGKSRLGDPFSLVADPTKALSMGMEWQTEVRDGIREYVRWFKKEAAQSK